MDNDSDFSAEEELARTRETKGGSGPAEQSQGAETFLLELQNAIEQM